jgi:hypothetical protein
MDVSARKKLRNTRRFINVLLKPQTTAKVPENFEAKDYIRFLPESANEQRAKDAFYFILDRIISHNQIYGSYLTTDYCEPVTINKTILKNIFGNGYTNYLNVLQNCGVIALSAKYRVGMKSSSYYLGPDFRYKRWGFRQYSTDTKAQISRHFSEDSSELKKRLEKYSHIVYWLTTDKITIDRENALKCIETIEKEYFKKLSDGQNHKQLDLFRDSSQVREQQIKNIITQIETNKHFSRVDANERLYTLFSSMPEPLRCFIQYNNQTLVAVDISNSQPFHFCYLFNRKFWSAQQSSCSLKSIYPVLHKSFENSGQLSFITKFVNKNKNATDVQEFIKKTTDGVFYEEIVSKYGDRYASLNTRDKAKKEFITFLNFDVTKKGFNRYGAYRQFANDFPNVATLMEVIKGISHTDMASILQRLEAKVLLKMAAKTFSSQFPEVPLFTIHDTIITLLSHQKELENIISTEYSDNIDYIPKIKPTPLTPQTAFENIERYASKKYAKV